MLMVIFGAGASYDSIPTYPPNISHVHRMPLANQLFENRDDFAEAMKSFSKCLPIIPYLRKSGIFIERELQALQTEAKEYPERSKQLAAIRYYLQFMLWECEYKWNQVARGITNQSTLLDQIERWRKIDEQVCLVTFNYDQMLEDALRRTLGIKIQTFPDYVGHNQYKLIKLHGSVNWAREVDTPLENIHNRNAWDIVHELIDRANEISISQRYQIVTDRPTGANGTTVLFPAIAIPVEEKLDYECPEEHLETLRKMIPDVDKILVIGWRATEQPFLQLLASNLKREVRGLVVAKDLNESTETIERLKQAGINGEYFPTGGGFADFVVRREGNKFLKS